MQSNTDVLNVLWDDSLKEFQVVDSNYNMIDLDVSLKAEENLYNIVREAVGDKIIDSSKLQHNVSDIYLYLVEKIYLASDRDEHKMHLFSSTLNYRAKENLIIAFNKVLNSKLEERLRKRVSVEYDA